MKQAIEDRRSLRETARMALTRTDEELAAECEWCRLPDAGLTVRHRPTGIAVRVDPRASDEKTRFFAILYLRNLLHDVRCGPRPKIARAQFVRRRPRSGAVSAQR